MVKFFKLPCKRNKRIKGACRRNAMTIVQFTSTIAARKICEVIDENDLPFCPNTDLKSFASKPNVVNGFYTDIVGIHS